jgi:hypothetical protein
MGCKVKPLYFFCTLMLSTRFYNGVWESLKHRTKSQVSQQLLS